MSRPNIDNKFKDTDIVLFECECKNAHYLEIIHDRCEKFPDEDLVFSFKDYPNSLWAAIKWWWQQKGLWQSEILLNLKDSTKLRDTLNEYIKYIDERKKNKKPSKGQKEKESDKK